MAFCNVSQFLAKRLIKNISSLDQVERIFKSSAYLAWDNIDILSGFGASEISSTPSNLTNRAKNLHRRGYGSKRNVNVTALESDQAHSADFIDNNLVPSADNFDIDQNVSQEFFSSDRRTNNCTVINKRDMVPLLV